MIVIASYNGINFLPGLIKSLEEFGPHDEEYLVVNNQSTDPEFINYLNTLDSSLNIKVETCPYNGYDTGAYLWAYRTFPAEEYMFLQDSIKIKDSNWFNEFRNKWTEDCGLVSWLVFDGMYDNSEQELFIKSAVGSSDTRGWGVFGPIFYTKKYVLDQLEEKELLVNCIPKNKNEQMGMERGWSAIMNLAGFTYSFIHYHNHAAILEDRLTLFTKFLPRR